MPVRDKSAVVNLDHEYVGQSLAHPQEQLPANIGWWTLYENEELNTLMKYAFANNPNIAQIHARLDQAKALTQQSRSALLPSLNVTGDRGTSNGDNKTPSDYNIVGAASFEVDLWGKNRSAFTSKQLEAKASEEDLYTAHITLSASIVENWLKILSLIEQQILLRKHIDVNNTVLDLQKKRFEMGSSTALDILQQEEILASSEAGLPDILSAQKQAANNIALLLGDTPYEGLKVSQAPFPTPLPIPHAGIPSDLLQNRPDIIAAWLRLLAADWATKSAWANRLPSFNLSATYSTTATALNGLFSTWLLDMVASATAPVFDAGNRKAEQLRQKALADERYHAYRETVLGAVIDVENSLVRNQYQDEKIVALEKQLSASKKTLEQAQLSYVNGDSNYINVLNSLKNSQSLEQQITRERLIQAKERVGLYRVLGGRNWATNVTPNIPSDQKESGLDE